MLSGDPRGPQELAATRLREHPTVPPSASASDVDAGALWPRCFCAFEGCMWEEQNGTEEDLQRHLQEEHPEDLKRICQHMLRGDAPDAPYSAYCQAIAEKCRGQAPMAGASLDRRALKSFAEAVEGGKVEALVCWSCGGIHPYVEEVADKGSINWYTPLKRHEATEELLFLNQPLKAIEKLLGLQLYLTRYNVVEPKQLELTANETFEDWRMRLPELQDGLLLCCPEDRYAAHGKHNLQQGMR